MLKYILVKSKAVQGYIIYMYVRGNAISFNVGVSSQIIAFVYCCNVLL